MKISNEIRFPHPVLGLDTNDYVAGDFSARIVVKEDFAQSIIEFEVNTVISDEGLSELVSTGRASAGVSIICPATYLNVVRPVQIRNSRIQFKAGSLWGRVAVRPFIWANDKLVSWQNSNVHPEFSEDGFEVAKGALLAIGEEIGFSVGRDKLAPIESIFEMRRAPDYPSGKITVSLHDEKIVILLSPDVHEAVCNLRANSVGTVTLVNSVYLPAVMEVLSTISSGEGDFEGRRWYSSFVAKCEFLGIQIASPKIFEDAQKLLEWPGSGLRLVAERIS